MAIEIIDEFRHGLEDVRGFVADDHQATRTPTIGRTGSQRSAMRWL